MTTTLLRLNNVISATALSKATIYRMIERNEFPAPVKIGGASRWSSQEVEEWMQQAIDARNAEQAA